MSPLKSFCALLTVLIFIGLVPMSSPVYAAPNQDFPFQQIDKDKIDTYIQSRMQAASIPGLALGIVRDDQIVYLKGYGIAGPDGRAVTPQTPFILGSTSKSFTALAIMQLVEAGKIDLDAPVTQYLSWFRTSDPTASAQITVRNLLNQNSGLPTDAGRQGMADNDQSDRALENGIRELAGVELSQPAGQSYEYANENYDTLGLIVQTASGISYEEYIRSAIFNPLQMNHSGAELSDPAVKDIATGYRYWFFWPVAFDASYPRRMTPSGFLISSVEDMTHYLIAQLNSGTYGNNQVLSSQGINTLHAPGAKISPLSSYGMGWVIEGQPGSTRIWHNGDVRNFHSNLLLLPDQHIGIVVLVNVGGFLKSAVNDIPIEGVAEILRGNGLTASTNPPLNIIPQVIMLVMFFIPILWIAWSYHSIKRWQNRGELPLYGISRLWRFYLPLVIDLLPVDIAWVILPAQFHASMQAIALFAPDAFTVIATITILSVGWALARVYLTLHPQHLMKHAIESKTESYWITSEGSL
ncbi:MAG: serine hydrolase [Anaerolineaceae bacterium]|nr:serine hydrolase [Anaerolineaceae bacterium]